MNNLSKIEEMESKLMTLESTMQVLQDEINDIKEKITKEKQKMLLEAKDKYIIYKDSRGKKVGKIEETGKYTLQIMSVPVEFYNPCYSIEMNAMSKLSIVIASNLKEYELANSEIEVAYLVAKDDLCEIY